MLVMAVPPPPAIHCTAEKPGKPPLDYLTCDVSLANESDALRWVLVQSTFYVPQQEGLAQIDGVTAHTVGSGVVLELHGNAAAWAIALAPKSEVVVRGLPISMWGVTEARIGEKSLASFGGTPISGEQWWAAAKFASGGRFPRYESRPFVTIDGETKLVPIDIPGMGSSAQRGMEKIRALVGAWTAGEAAKDSIASFELISKGKFVMQKSGFTGVFQQDGESILVTLFPDDGYQARYRSTGLEPGSSAMEFRLVDHTNWTPPASPPAKSFTFEIADSNTARQVWQFTFGDKPTPVPISLKRKK